MTGREETNTDDGQAAVAAAAQAVERERCNNNKNDRTSEAPIALPNAIANDVEASNNLSLNDNLGSSLNYSGKLEAAVAAGVH